MKNYYIKTLARIKVSGFINRIILLILILSTSNQTIAQCACAGTNYGNINTNGWIVGQTQTQGVVWAGERVTISNTVAGATYRISTCGASYDTQLTIYTTACAFVGYNDDNGPACTGTRASIDVVSPGGDLFAKLNQFNCNTNSTSTNVIVTLISLPTPAYRATWAAQNYGSTSWCAGETRSVSVTVQNTGTVAWTSNTGNNVNFSWWWNTQGQDTNPRMFPFVNLAPGASQVITFNVTAPAAPGNYTLNYDLVKEADCWFRNNNGSCGSGNISYASPSLTVVANPALPTSPGVSICGPATANLTASGSTGVFNWYTDAAGTNLVGTNPTYTTPSLAVNTDYYVRAIAAGTACMPGAANVPGASYNSADSWITPFSTVWHDTRRQYIVTAAELTAAGFCAGNLTSLSLYVNSLGTPNLTGLNFKIKNTASTTLAGFEGGVTTVWSGNYNPTIGMNTFNFSAPHYWDGTSNILVEMCFDNNSWSTNFGVQMQDVPAGMAFGGYNDNITGACNYAAYTITIDNNKRPQFRFAGQVGTAAPTCTSNMLTVPVTVNTSSTVPVATPVAGTICPNTNTALTAAGGVAGTGSNIYWYTGPNGTGTLVGTGSPINVAPSVGTTYYARRQGACNTTGDAVVNVQIKNYVYATNGTTSNTYCTDNTGWNHFYNGDDIIFSAQGNFSGAAAGFPQVTIYDNGTYFQQTEGPGTAPGCVLNQTPGEERFEMERSWNVNMGGGSSIGTYDIRFYYPPAERTVIENAANTWMATYPDCGYTYKYPTPNGFFWFKNNGSNYVAPQYENTQYGASIGTTANGLNYAQWTGLNGFSGGSGSVILVPLSVLPVELTSLTANCNEAGNEVHVRWTTATETNSSHFNVERSVDGYLWETVATVAAAGNSSQAQHYEIRDTDVRGYSTLYYRLGQYDYDGASTQYGPISVNCAESLQGWDVFPNPTTNQVSVVVYGTYASETSRFVITDINGKLLQEFNSTPEKGTLMTVDLSSYTPGVYLIRLINIEGNSEVRKIVKQ